MSTVSINKFTALRDTIQQPIHGVLELVRHSNLLEVAIYLLQESDSLGQSVDTTCELLGLVSSIYFLDKQAAKDASNVTFFDRLWSLLESRHLPTALWVI